MNDRPPGFLPMIALVAVVVLVIALLLWPQAAERLGVKLATLYAYVSRGVLSPRRAQDGRSLF